MVSSEITVAKKTDNFLLISNKSMSHIDIKGAFQLN